MTYKNGGKKSSGKRTTLLFNKLFHKLALWMLLNAWPRVGKYADTCSVIKPIVVYRNINFFQIGSVWVHFVIAIILILSRGVATDLTNAEDQLQIRKSSHQIGFILIFTDDTFLIRLSGVFNQIKGREKSSACFLWSKAWYNSTAIHLRIWTKSLIRHIFQRYPISTTVP